MSERRKTVKWDVHRLSVEVDDDSVQWGYVEKDGKIDVGGCVRIEVDADGWAVVETDAYEGHAMFPAALIPYVRKLLKLPAHPSGDAPR